MTDEKRPEQPTPPSPAGELLDEIHFALARNNWQRLRELSIQPGGFGHEGRKEVWPFVLHATAVRRFSRPATSQGTPPLKESPKGPGGTDSPGSSEPEKVPDDTFEEGAEEPHPDERQVGLDTDRSFVVYPPEGQTQRATRKAELHDLIVGILRRRRRLSYFQGYHDVISVLYLTLRDSSESGEQQPSPLLLSCGEKVSLHRLRDSMGTGLDPLVGYLRILKRLFQVADSDLASIIEKSSPLPYFALSHILTLFSHDVPTLALIQRIFDFLLCRPPIMVIYLVAAMVISRKEEILKEAEGEEGMMHSILSRLPDMFPDGENDDGNGDALPAISAVAKPSTSEPEAKQANPEPSAVEPIPSEVTSDPPPPYQPSEDIAQNDPSTIEHSTATQPPSTAPTKLVPISRLLKHADELFALYPPSHPSLCVDTIMGPNSVIFTWSENDHVDLSQPKGEEGPRPSSSGEKTSSSVGTSQRCLPSDDAAEEMVLDRSSVVFPYDPESEFPQESDNEGVYKPRPPRPKRSLPRGWIDLTRIDKRTVLAAMVVLLGVGIALYAGSDYRRRANTQVMWKALVGWAGSFVAGLVGMDDDAYE